ncbi:MAG: trypsin-like peptidase domain-containing protein [Patescibacteria group bacterium]|nr:trypsin-like peptidase domain-containing protein [Patescibacteria group bacterium]MDE1944171.1 trypsin-like peptidase domain-containing protein [Patescibacteria group bacterium]MDE1945445.1 trypsin-like peptidase domain-containing protein [Patescibacteria group bacterium]MDE2057248.1 trypsin-like peptidase domain-containing protein [Patescibacteria group bacterium]
MVDINCDTGYGGSGTVFTSDGTILTNNHVIQGAKECEVTIPDPATGQISKIYKAVPSIVPKLSKKYDVATLKIDAAYTDKNGKTWGTYPATFTAFVSPSTCDPTQPSKLGDSVRIYGYPVTSGGYNLTVTDGLLSSFSDNGYILTSAKVDSGNSGGLAVDQDGCWLGIPSAVEAGNYQNLGVIIPGEVVAANFLNAVAAKADPAAIKSPLRAANAESAATPQLSNDQICQSGFGQNSEWSGQLDSSGKPTCRCKDGYSWDASGNACALQSDLEQWCESNYGTGSYSSPQNGKATCGCDTGYTWNAGQTACVPQETNDEQCQADYGIGSYWTGTTNAQGGPTCGCQSGYVWNTAQTECVAQPSCPLYSSYDASAGQCECWSGYVTTATGCESALTYCENKEGFGATYDAATNSCECEPGYMFDGSTCQSGYSYCSARWGVGAEYDYNTNGCACGYGYTVNSSGTGCQSIYSTYY